MQDPGVELLVFHRVYIVDEMQVPAGGQLLSGDASAFSDDCLPDQMLGARLSNGHCFAQVLDARASPNFPAFTVVENLVAPLGQDGQGNIWKPWRLPALCAIGAVQGIRHRSIQG